MHVLSLALLVFLQIPVPNSIPVGQGQVRIETGREPLTVYTYKPKTYKNGPLLFVFHGVKRNADEYCKWTIPLGDKLGALVVAPQFDDKRFTTDRFQRGGLLTRSGELRPAAEWTWSYVPLLATKIRSLEGRKEMPYALIGHSGGGQFLARLAAFADTDATVIVASNPGTHIFPTPDMNYPLGFGRLPAELRDEKALRRYLAQPLTLYLGTADTVRDQYFEKSAAADRQGKSRYERGQNAFKTAEALAKQKGWPFHWKLVEAPGVGHNAELMFAHANAEIALQRQKKP